MPAAAVVSSVPITVSTNKKGINATPNAPSAASIVARAPQRAAMRPHPNSKMPATTNVAPSSSDVISSEAFSPYWAWNGSAARMSKCAQPSPNLVQSLYKHYTNY
jgi:hypothetical protein